MIQHDPHPQGGVRMNVDLHLIAHGTLQVVGQHGLALSPHVMRHAMGLKRLKALSGRKRNSENEIVELATFIIGNPP